MMEGLKRRRLYKKESVPLGEDEEGLALFLWRRSVVGWDVMP